MAASSGSLWKLVHVLSNRFVEMTAKGISGREIPSLSPHGREPVGIHDVNLAGDDGEGHVQDVLGVVGWIIVNDASSCVLEPTLEKARGLFSLGFDVGDVGHGGPIEGARLSTMP